MSTQAPSWKGIDPVGIRLGRRVNQVRTSKGLTQMQVAIDADLDRSFISDIERGVKEPTISTIEMLAKAFSMTILELLDGV